MDLGARLDAAMAAAWPAAITETTGERGWVLRYADGVTRRANSALAIGTPENIDDAIEAAERFYESRGNRPMFLVSDASTPARVVANLAARGYVEDSLTSMLQRPVDLGGLVEDSPSGWTIEVSPEATDTWVETYWSVEAERRGPAAQQVFRDVLLRPLSPTRFVMVADQSSAVSIGQVIVADDLACIQCLATVATGRRRGAAQVAVEHLVALARSLGATVVFAAVMADNAASLGLFEALGFVKSHQYRYLIARQT